MTNIATRASLGPAMIALCIGACLTMAQGQIAPKPSTMKKLGEVDPRFLSFNVEAVEVTGGRFWKPYRDEAIASKAPTATDQNQPTGMDASLYQYRAPIDLSNPKLRKLAAALSPAFLRVSGTWRNSTYFQNDDQPAMATPPDGYKGVMTRAEWKGVVDFSHAVGAELVTSVATSGGTRDAAGIWTPDAARTFFNYTKSIGGHIAATEFMNEPTFAMVGGAPKGYDAAAYGADMKLFANFLKKEFPDILLLGPGSVGEGVSLTLGAPMPGFINTPDMMKATGPIYDVFSYHFYPTVSRRCTGPKAATTPEQALTTEWLDRNLTVEAFYRNVRDEFMPGKPLWLTETGEAGCGGDPFAGEFLDSFRFMDQLGSLAQKGVKTVMVNTLASSDYGLLDEETLEPRPNYWAALLWKRNMGVRVLDPGFDAGPNTRVYAQCSAPRGGGVTVMVLNLDRTAYRSIDAPSAGEQYTLSATDVLSKSVSLNGTQLNISHDGSLPALTPKPFKPGALRVAPLTISFLVFPNANNGSCK